MDKHLMSQMTDEMKELYKDFFGNMDRLKGEWQLCNEQYNNAKTILEKNQSTMKARLEIRKITDYWIRRRQALERVFDADTIESFKK